MMGFLCGAAESEAELGILDEDQSFKSYGATVGVQVM
jgi:hypothetical protein